MTSELHRAALALAGEGCRIPRWQEALFLAAEAGDECVEWTYNNLPSGYGQVWLYGPPTKRKVYLHRFVYATTHGLSLDDIEGLVVRHTCDNPPCFNPAHLLIGTHADNVRDKMERGRDHQTRKTECPHGHPYDEANTLRHGRQGRRCRACKNADRRRRRAFLRSLR